MGKNIKFIYAPISVGCDKEGPNIAPNKFKEGGIEKWFTDLGHKITSTALPEYSVKEGEEKIKFREHPNVKYITKVYEANIHLREEVKKAFKEGTFPMIIGGDHTLGLGSMSGVSSEKDSVGVIWFDAHGDINNETTSPSGNSHGMPCAAAIGICDSKLNDIAEKKLNAKNFFWVGARDLDKGEQEYMEANQLHVYTTQEIKEKGMLYVVKDIIQKIGEQGIKNIHCSIDIDGMDPTIVKATGTRVPKGMDNEDYRIFVTELLSKTNIVSCDFVEYNPLLEDEEKTTFEWCKKALQLLAANL